MTSLVSYAVSKFLLIYIPNPKMCSSGLQGRFLLLSIPLTKALGWSCAPSPRPINPPPPGAFEGDKFPVYTGWVGRAPWGDAWAGAALRGLPV